MGSDRAPAEVWGLVAEFRKAAAQTGECLYDNCASQLEAALKSVPRNQLRARADDLEADLAQLEREHEATLAERDRLRAELQAAQVSLQTAQDNLREVIAKGIAQSEQYETLRTGVEDVLTCYGRSVLTNRLRALLKPATPEAQVERGDIRVGCAECGEPEREHHYNGACYGKCGRFVDPRQPGPEPRTDNATATPGHQYATRADVERLEAALRRLLIGLQQTPDVPSVARAALALLDARKQEAP